MTSINLARYEYSKRLSISFLFVIALVACAKTSIPTPILSGIVQITAGWRHTCALTAEGRVRCWGNNLDGQLGDGTQVNRKTPEGVVGLIIAAKEISAGSRHTCALTTAESVRCWGNNRDRQLGDGTNIDRVAPVDVVGLTSGMRAVTAGEGHTCALTTAGNVKCWGNNREGQLGDGTTVSRNTPVNVDGLTNRVSMITAGLRHTCVLTIAGSVKCWGNNQDGQLGDGTTVGRDAPVDVLALTNGIKAITAGERHTCALTAARGVKCWGNNRDGQLGDGTVIERVTPVDVAGLTSEVSAITAGEWHTCALTTVGSVQCWGNNNDGQLGDGTVIKKVTPIDAMLLMNRATAITGGGQHTCALTPDNTNWNVNCWGSNEHGQLGYQ